jgi:hypothetical protein
MQPRPPASAAPRAAQPADLPGLYRRLLISWPGGGADTSTRVRWLQGTSAYLDLRQPAELWRPAGPTLALPPVATVRCLADASREHCLRLARQEGFAGRLAFDGTYYEWQRAIDYQPPAGVDSGTLHWEAALLVETGRDMQYLEHWQRAPGAPAQPCCALELWDPGAGVRGSLLAVGPYFMFARDRTARLPSAGSLEAAVAACASLEEARALVSCEISFGSIHRGRFLISASTLPWRVRQELAPQLDGHSATTAEQNGDGERVRRRWEVTASEGDPAALPAAL